ncbi:MAG: peptide chain release factor 3, partial [Sulfitobacter sp.]
MLGPEPIRSNGQIAPGRGAAYMGRMLDTPQNRPALPAEIARRRTFAIISHPDAGKTTL